MFKWFIIVILVIAVLIGGLLWFLSNQTAVSNDYHNALQTGGTVEETYAKDGPSAVIVKEYATLQNFKNYTLVYPENIEHSEQQMPVIVLANGTGTPVSKYIALAKHYASWGFIVIGTQEEFSWNAFGVQMSVEFLKKLQTSDSIDNQLNPLYGKIDLDNMGVLGHSQGGVGVFNALTYGESPFKTGVALSPTNKNLADNLMWPYNLEEIKVPILLLAGAGGGDDWVVTDEQLTDLYQMINSTKIKMRRSNTDHGQMLYTPSGYVTAWMMWQLKNDQNASKAFEGNLPEIVTNNLYQDVQYSINQDE